MCGIIGILERNSDPDRDAFHTGLRALGQHGRPNREGVVTFPRVLLGQCRLSPRAPGDNGCQPALSSDTSSALVCNGKLYNDRELRALLSPSTEWRKCSDAEVLLSAFIRYGADICPRLSGMFAFAVYEPQRRRLTLARDCFGKKSLYYYHDSSCFAFASELKGLLPLLRNKGIPLSIDAAIVPKYLVHGYIPGEQSLVTGIKRLPPSTVLIFDLNLWRVASQHCFWSPETIPLDMTISHAEAVDRADSLISASTRKRLVSDVPVCIFLSGGVDSGIVAAHAARHSSDIQAHSIVYPESPDVDENLFAQKTADALGIPLHAHPFRDSDVSNTFTSLLDYLDEPIADGALIPLHFLALQAVADTPVALSGDGGDELFGGYVKYRAQAITEPLPLLLRRLMAAIGQRLPVSQYTRLLTTLPYPFFARQFLWGSGSPLPFQLKRWMSDADWSPEAIFSDAADLDRLWLQKDTVNRSLFLDWRILLPDGYLVKSDRATRAAGLEQRAPLLDKDLAEFALSLPGNLKMAGGFKSILKKAAARHVPPECIYRPKHGFGVPMDKWLRNELRPLIEPLLLDITASFFDKKQVAQAWKDHLTGIKDNRFILLRIALLHAFYDKLRAYP